MIIIIIIIIIIINNIHITIVIIIIIIIIVIIINNTVVTNNFIHNFQLRTYLNTQKQSFSIVQILSHCTNLILILNNKNTNYKYKTLFPISCDKKEEHLDLVRKKQIQLMKNETNNNLI